MCCNGKIIWEFSYTSAGIFWVKFVKLDKRNFAKESSRMQRVNQPLVTVFVIPVCFDEVTCT